MVIITLIVIPTTPSLQSYYWKPAGNDPGVESMERSHDVVNEMSRTSNRDAIHSINIHRTDVFDEIWMMRYSVLQRECGEN